MKCYKILVAFVALAVSVVVFSGPAFCQTLPEDVDVWDGVELATTATDSTAAPGLMIGRKAYTANVLFAYATKPFRYRKLGGTQTGSLADSTLTVPVDTLFQRGLLGGYGIEYPCQLTLRGAGDVKFWPGASDTVFILWGYDLD